MKETLHYSFILAMICVIAAGLLASVNALTKPKIITQAHLQEEQGLREIFPEGVRFEPAELQGTIVYYKVYSKIDKFMGIAFKTLAKGYSSRIEMVVGMGKDGKILAMKIINQNETPGLGSRITEPPFIEKFSHKDILELAQVEAITGATISSRAVIEAVKEKAKEIKELIKNEK